MFPLLGVEDRIELYLHKTWIARLDRLVERGKGALEIAQLGVDIGVLDARGIAEGRADPGDEYFRSGAVAVARPKDSSNCLPKMALLYETDHAPYVKIFWCMTFAPTPEYEILVVVFPEACCR